MDAQYLPGEQLPEWHPALPVEAAGLVAAGDRWGKLWVAAATIQKLFQLSDAVL